MAKNTINTRIQLKSDTETNWNKAVLVTDGGEKQSGTSFVPLAGEVIIYSTDDTHPFSRFKVGNGTTTVNNLPFSTGIQPDWNENNNNTLSYINNKPVLGNSAYINAATPYSNASSYNVGDYVIYNNQLYYCNTTISSPENWNSNHWTTTNIMNEVMSKKKTQTVVNDPTANGNSLTFIATISQNAQGVITPTKKTVSTMGAATSSNAGTAGLVPAPGSGKQTSFLRGDGTWVVPTDTITTATTSGSGNAVTAITANNGALTVTKDTTFLTTHANTYGKITPANSTGTSALTGNTTAVEATSSHENIKFSAANKWIVLAGSNSATAGSDELKFGHLVPTSITNNGPAANQTGSRGSTFNIPKITLDAAGHVTQIDAITVSLPSSDNTDTLVKQTSKSDSVAYKLLMSTSASPTSGNAYESYYATTLSYNPSTKVLTNGTITLTSASSTTANTAAYDVLKLGNATNVTSTTAHSEGKINLYSAATKSHIIVGKSTTTDYTHTLPNKTGIIVTLDGTPANNIGAANQSIYVTSEGVVTAGNTYYAPSTAGISGQLLQSNGTNTMPDWINTVGVAHGGTGATSFTANSVIMSGNTTTAALTTKGITDNSSNTDVTSSDTNLITGRTLYYQLAKKAYAPLASPTFTGTPKSVTPTSSSDSQMIATKEYVDNSFAANDAMIFKGTLNGATNTTYTPAAQRGDTYKVAVAGKINGINVEIGDMLICITDNTAAATSSNVSTINNNWVVIQNNVDGAVFKGANTFTDAQVLIADGTNGKIKTSGYTIAKSVPSDAKFTDTTYTFSGGTNKITITPSNGTAQDITITPSITNNVTGSGTNGYLTKFSGTNTITNGPQLGSSTTTFLRNDGTWATPSGAVTGVKGSAESNYRTGQVNLTAANVGAVATSGNETITGNKTFSGTTTLSAGSVYPSSQNTIIIPNAGAIIQSPIPKYLWHDILGFCRATTPTYYTTTNGSTWTQSTLEKRLFAHMNSWGNQQVINSSISGSRWIWHGGGFAYSNITWIVLGITYNATIATFDLVLETTADATATSPSWTTLCNVTGVKYSSQPIWIKTNNPSTGDFRLTITRSSGDDATTILPLCAIEFLTTRWGDQGKGNEFEFPYQWDGVPNIYPLSNNTSTLGTSSYKWKNVYATTFTGDLTGNISGTATNVTGTIAIDNGGTGATSAVGARTNLGLGSMATETATDYLKLSGGTMTGNLLGNATATLGSTTNPFHQLILGGATNATMTADSTNPRITFQESNNGSQPVHLIYSDYDSYRSPAGLKIIGGSGATPAWFEVEGAIYATSYTGSAAGLTNIPAGQLTGTIADARLSSNVALKDASTAFISTYNVANGSSSTRTGTIITSGGIHIDKSLKIGKYTNTSTAIGEGIRIHDLRNISENADKFGDQAVNWYFNTVNGKWASIMSMKGWTDTYYAWEIAGNAANELVDKYYVRTMTGTNTGTWHTLAYLPAFASKGNTTKPIYVDSTGEIKELSYTIETSVPNNAIFTDTTYSFTGGTNKIIVTPAGGTAQDVAITISHANGNITNSGTITSTGVTIANGDAFLISDNSNNGKIERTSITFDGSTTTKALTQKGTWETFNNYSLPLAANGTRGGVQIGYTTSGNNYAVQLSSEKMYVNVPWTDANVTQTATTTNATYELLFSSTADNTTRTEGTRKTSTLTYNPSTKALSTGGAINGYTLAAASAKGVDTSIAASSNSTNLPTSAAVATFVEGKGYKTTQTAVNDPSTSGTGITYISSISQNTNGVITATKSTVRDASSTQSGVVSTGNQVFAGQKTFYNVQSMSLAGTGWAYMSFHTRAGTGSRTANFEEYTTNTFNNLSYIYAELPYIRKVYADATSTTPTQTIYGNNKFFFREYSMNSDNTSRLNYYEEFNLPACNRDRTANGTYTILTTKSTITVPQGGTGATSFASGSLLVGNGTGSLTTITKTSSNTANTVVARDGSGNFSAGTITASLSGTATSADYPSGFASRSTTATWGNTTGTCITSWNGGDGCEIAFFKNNPASGQLSMKIDGTIYIKEGGQDISAAVKSFNVSGQTVTYTTLWGNTSTFTTQDTKNTAGSTNSTSQLYLIGATSQGANPQTYSYSHTYVKDGLLSSTKLGINLAGVEKAYVEWNATDSSLDFIFV